MRITNPNPDKASLRASTPSDATVVITDENGKEIFRGTTPTTVTLNKSDGTYWGEIDYTVIITKDGHQTQTIPVRADPNGWYVAGNLVFGGLIGWFIVDPLSGDMYSLTPEQINSAAEVGKTDVSHNNNEKGSISEVLLKDVPVALRDQMKKIN